MTHPTDNLDLLPNRPLSLMPPHWRASAATFSLVNAIMLAGAAHGQEQPTSGGTTNAPSASGTATNAPTNLPEVVVQGQQEPAFKVDQLSSPRYTQPLVDVPQTVVAVPKEVYTQQGATTLSDVLRNTPGITFAAGEGGNVAAGDAFFMRGTDTSSSIFVDGVRDSGGYFRDVFNVEQVEIFKGPTGADNGRGGSSGYVNMVTKTPSLTKAHSGSLSYGSAEHKRLTVDLNQPFKLGDDGDWLSKSSLRLNGLWQDGGVPGRDFVEDNRWAIAPSLALGLGTPTRLTLSAAYLEQDNVPDSGLPVVALPGGLAGGVDQENFYGLADRDFDDVQSGRVLARLEHDLNDHITLRSQTAYTRTDRDALISYFQNSSTNATTFTTNNAAINPATGTVPPSYTPFDPVTGTVTPRRLRTQTENSILHQQLSANTAFSTGFIEHELGAGVDFTREDQFSPTWQAVGGVPTSIFDPNPFRVPTVAQTPYQATNNPYAEARIDSAGLFLFNTLKPNQYFQLSGSVRYDHYDVDYASVPAAFATNNTARQTLDADGDLLSWKAGITFKPHANGSLYFAYGNTFTPPGSGFALSSTANNQNNPNLDPQEARNYEVGTKWDFFDKRLSTSLALYHSENLNIVSTDATTSQVTQDISETVRGIEFGLSGRITENWFVFGGVGFADAEREASGTTAAGTQDGADLRFLPRLSANLWTAYKFPFGLTLGGGINYSDSVIRSTANNLTTTPTSIPEAPSFTVLNLMAAYDVSKHFTLRANVNNVTDEEYFRLNNNGGRYYPGTPRSFLLAGEFKW
ncbi:MAG TPA: TonB-dependent siderophore receptor [Methylomirabilota bacterium]|nr:TonB-dependent siderophore receptor [Methylomirabilota bacterium]